MKETFKLDYQTCVDHVEAWQALGRNYTAVACKKDWKVSQIRTSPRFVIFHLLDMDNVDMGIRITVHEGDSHLLVEFLPSGRYLNNYHYEMDAIPVQPFRNPERVKAWDDFVRVMREPALVAAA